MSQKYDEETVVEYLILRLIEAPSMLDSVPPSLRRRIGDEFMKIARKRRQVGHGNPDKSDIHGINGIPSPWDQPVKSIERPGFHDLSHLVH